MSLPSSCRARRLEGGTQPDRSAAKPETPPSRVPSCSPGLDSSACSHPKDRSWTNVR